MASSGQLLVTLVDHAKPFKGTWQIYREGDTHFAACHSPSPDGDSEEPPSCQAFSSNKHVCQFTHLLQFYGWSIAGETPESLQFRRSCEL